MEDEKQKHSHGFTWGMIVGGAVVLMLTTKRGRQILKEVTDGGIEGLDQYLDIDKIKALTSEFDDEDEDLETPAERKKTTSPPDESLPAKLQQLNESSSPEQESPSVIPVKKTQSSPRRVVEIEKKKDSSEDVAESKASPRKPRLFKRKKK